MAEVYADADLRPVSRPHNADAYAGPLALAFIVLLTLLSLYWQRPPAPAPADAPADAFSSGRAMQQLREIAKDARPVGTAEHARVRDYIVGRLGELGLSPQVQEATGVAQARGTFQRAGSVSNILARVPGTAGGKAVLLVAHYDSVASGPGASDDGAGVATLLETARALKSSAPLRNDVLFLFSDAEEVGSLGAKAFVDEHPWAANVGVALNFEARGNGGPSVMFETSDGNGALIGEFAKAAPRPLANSLSYEIYRLLPNDTDLTVFKKAGWPGLNFAYIGGLVHYHTATDNVASVDEGSVQHQGSYALALARHFGDLGRPAAKQGNAVYFDVLGATLVSYPAAWALPVAGLVLLAFASVVVFGLRRRQLSVGGLLVGFLAFLLSLVAAVAAVTLAWRGVLAVHGGYRSLPLGDIYNSGYYMWAFVALTAAVVTALHIWFGKRVSVDNLAVGAMFWWLLLTLATSVMLPGASYVFAWPLLFGLVALGADFVLRVRRQGATRRAAVVSAGAVPALVLVVPVIYMVFVALSLGMAGAVAVLLVLLLGLLTPHMGLLMASRKWLVPGVAAAAFAVLLVAGGLTAGFDREHPKPDSIFYGLNADTARAVWASGDAAPDEWTSKFMASNMRREALDDFFPGSPRPFLQADAQAAPLAGPEVSVIGDATENGVRTLRLRVSSPRRAPVVALTVGGDAEVVGGEVGGRPIWTQPAAAGNKGDALWGLQYYALPAEGVELVVRVKSSKPVAVRAVDQSYGLPALPEVSPRPEHLMASMLPLSDSTFVSKSYQF